jgi:hypothetical protein
MGVIDALRIQYRIERRAVALLVAATVLGVPAAVMRILCVGGTCEPRGEALAKTPFCSLPDDVRRLIERGTYDGRSPDIVAVTGPSLISGMDAFGQSTSAPLWPSTDLPDDGTIPLVFAGTGVREGMELPPGSGLDDVSETIATIIDLRRPHPEVRSGNALTGVETGKSPRLVLEVVWKGIGSNDLERRPQRWPQLRRLMRRGAATTDAVVGSLPLDPAAALATIGTGGLPSHHGVIGTTLRRDVALSSSSSGTGLAGKVVRAWDAPSFETVIATLSDHLDEKLKQEPKIGLIGTDRSDRGLIGGHWYELSDRDTIVMLDRTASVREQVKAVRALLRHGDFGRDQVPDLAGIVLSGPVRELDTVLGRLVRTASRASRRSAAVVVAATGADHSGRADEAMKATTLRKKLERSIPAQEPVVEAVVPGGLYLDQQALARLELSDEVVVSELLAMRSPSGNRLLADAFPSIAINFGRYC